MKIIVFLLVCIASANAFFLSPSVFDNKKKIEKTLCPDRATRESQDRDFEGTRTPWFECSNAGLVHIDRCEIEISSFESCPTVYNARSGNPPEEPTEEYDACRAGYSLTNSNCSALVSSACNGKAECNFDWELLPEVYCIHPFEDNLDRPYRSQLQVHVSYKCNDKRKQCKLNVNSNIRIFNFHYSIPTVS